MDFDVYDWSSFEDDNEWMLAMHQHEQECVAFLLGVNDQSIGVLNSDIQWAYDVEVESSQPSEILMEGELTRSYMDELLVRLSSIARHIKDFSFKYTEVDYDIPF